MPNLSSIKFVPYQPEFGWALVALWRQAFQEAVGLPADNPLNAFTDQLAYWQSVEPASVTVALDSQSSQLAGFMVQVESEIDHLYLAPTHQRIGLGSAFVDRAKAASPDGIALYTFQANSGAQKFYLAHGFHEVARGCADMESNPWATSKDQLADIRYTWQP